MGLLTAYRWAMPVNSEHPQYLQMAATWAKCRAAVSGEKAVKALGEQVLPRLSGEHTKEYEARIGRASYFNATGRTRDLYQGLLFNERPQVSTPAEIADWLTDIALTGESFEEFLRRAAGEVLDVSRAGILVDMPRVEAQLSSKAEFDALGLRPYLSLYRAEDVINWKEARVLGRRVLTMVVLREPAPVIGDEFSTMSSASQWRYLRWTSEGIVGSVWSRNEKDELIEGHIYQVLDHSGASLVEIPFVFLDPVSGTSDVETPILSDIVDVNLAHFRNSADYENGLHWIGTPTPIFIGRISTSDGAQVTEVRMGSNTGINLDAGGDAKFLEFTGQGLNSLKDAMAEKRDQMAILGSRALVGEKNGVEAAQTAAIYRAGESSSLASIAAAIAKQVTRALEIARDWYGASGDVSVTLNTDYTTGTMTAQEVTALTGAVQSGNLPVREYIGTLLERGAIITDRTKMPIDEIVAEVEARDGSQGFSFQPGATT